MASARSTAELAEDLTAYLGELPLEGEFSTHVAVFTGSRPTDEEAFEALLWRQLQTLSDADAAPWAAGLASNPEDPQFAFSFAGIGFFVVGMHANSSRWSRQFTHPTLVFNLHSQFETLRTQGKMESFQRTIRKGDIGLQGQLNPNLTNFGEGSDARQYSGRLAEADWACPFRRRAS